MPIALSEAEWARIQQWTITDREDSEVARRRDLVKFLDETSREMTKTWPNSLENVNKRNEEIRQARIQMTEQANSNFYKRYVKRRKEDRERMMYSARESVFKNKDAPKLLLGAFIETCVQKERMEQIKFLNERRREAAEQKRKEEDDIIRKAKEWEQMKADQKRRRYEADKEYQTEILMQANEISEKKRNEYETEMNMQRIDNIKANQQMEAIKEFEENFRVSEKARILLDMRQARREAEARRAEQAARARLDDRLVDVVTRSRARVERQRLATEEEHKAARRRVLEAISARLETGAAASASRDQAALEAAAREKDAADKRRRDLEAKKLADVKAARIEQRRAWERDEAEKMRCLDTQLQWSIMNRFKNVELHKEFKEKLRQEELRKMREYRAEILRLWKEREDREARELAETRHFYGELALKKLRDADNKLLAHAQELIEEARAHGRPDYALRSAVDRYCRLYRLYPLPPLPRSVAEHFPGSSPRAGSRPDPQHRPPPPGPAADYTETDLGPGGKRDGLQPESSTSKKIEQVKKEENVADYKRAGKANGLQRRNAQTDLTLPPITVIPCKNDACSCLLKKCYCAQQ